MGIVLFALGFERGKIVQEKQDDARVQKEYANARNYLNDGLKKGFQQYTDAHKKQETEYRKYLNELAAKDLQALTAINNACNDRVNKAIKNTLALKGK